MTVKSRSPLSAMPVEYLTPAIEDRAIAVQGLLADRGHHRAPSVPDLLLAATGELADLTVLHVDKDFDLVAEVTVSPSSVCSSKNANPGAASRPAVATFAGRSGS